MSRLRSSQDSGFSVKIGTVPPKSGWLDTLLKNRTAKSTFFSLSHGVTARYSFIFSDNG